LEIGELSLRTHTCAVLLLTSDDRHLKLHDCRSASDRVQRDRIPAGEGLLGGVLKRGTPVRIASASALNAGHYEPGAPPIHALLARLSGVSSPGKALEGKTFADNNGLVSNVVRYGAPLPGRELRAMDHPVVFDDDTVIRGLGALKIFPLTAGDRILGTLVAGSRKKGPLDVAVLRMLEVLAIQAGQSVLRAQLFEQMEKMATTDGLTGLVNHRTFQAKADEALATARRYGRKCSLILTDIDHFKSVNDTYGHPIGDVLLRGVAR